MKNLKKIKQWWHVENLLFYRITECNVTNGAVIMLLIAVIFMMLSGALFVIEFGKWMIVTLVIAIVFAVKFFRELVENPLDE